MTSSCKTKENFEKFKAKGKGFWDTTVLGSPSTPMINTLVRPFGNSVPRATRLMDYIVQISFSNHVQAIISNCTTENAEEIIDEIQFCCATGTPLGNAACMEHRDHIIRTTLRAMVTWASQLVPP